MTNEECIKMLKSKLDGNTDTSYEWCECVRLAIKALEQLQEKPEYIDIWNVGAILRNIPEQPDICKIYGGVCGYPIEACSECLKHEGWRPSKEQTSYKSDARRWKRCYLDLKQRIFKLEEQTRWIPVSERLPKVGEKVLCQCQANIFEVLKLTVDGWYHDDNHCYMLGFVIAWQPLPQPYAESEDKEMTEEDKLYADELKNKALADYERLDLAINELERQMRESET